jgi:hypothetical protein
METTKWHGMADWLAGWVGWMNIGDRTFAKSGWRTPGTRGYLSLLWLKGSILENASVSLLIFTTIALFSSLFESLRGFCLILFFLF